jgi:hypothetical protein
MPVQVSREISVFHHGNDGVASDALTSDIPTFPYTAEECDRFINLLQCRKGVLR